MIQQFLFIMAVANLFFSVMFGALTIDGFRGAQRTWFVALLITLMFLVNAGICWMTLYELNH